MTVREALLERVLRRGWSEGRRNQFLKRYGRVIRWSILYNISMRFGSQSLAAVGDYLLSLQEGQQPRSQEGIVGEILDLAADTWQDVLNDVFKEEDNLIQKYQRYVAKAQDARRGFIDFSRFLSKNVSYKFLDNLSKGLSDKELLDRIADLKRESDRRYCIDELRDRYREHVEATLRSKFPQLHQVNNVIDYFFERFVPESYPSLRRAIASEASRAKGKAKGNLVNLLLERFSWDDCQKGSNYVRQVYGGMAMTVADADAVEELAEAKALKEEIPLNDEVNYYWDQLIRCLEPDPGEVERLVRSKPNEGNVLCWACARLKRGFKRQEQKENLVAFIVFYISKRRIAESGREGMEELTPESLTLERVVGRDLRWREDVCQGIFKKHIRKDRVMEQIRREIMASDYGYLVVEERTGHE